MSNRPTLLPLPMIARRFGVTPDWLRDEADAGRLPHLRAGRRIIMDLDTIRGILAARARGETSGKGKGVRHGE